jgi:hypothetical protein
VIRVAALIVGVALAVGILWLAGEQHRENCIRSGAYGCGVLPWDNGERARLNELGCLQERRAGVSEDDLPSECRR